MPPKPPVRVGDRLRLRVGGAAGERQDRREARVAGDLSRERGGFRRAAEDQDAEGHGRE